jgi:hypothetical protein
VQPLFQEDALAHPSRSPIDLEFPDRGGRRSATSHLRSRRERAEIERSVLFDALAARQLSGVPPAAQRLDQRGTRDEPALANVDGRHGVAERSLIGDDPDQCSPGLFPTRMRVVYECGAIQPAAWVRLHDVE